MTAGRINRFGPPNVIRLEEIEVPKPGDGEILVRVKAAGVGPWDAWIRMGRSVLPQPLPLTLGSDISGVVDEVGSDVHEFAPGEAVFGVTNRRFTGGYAEYAVAQAGMMAGKPGTLLDVEAASVPVVAVAAWQMLFDYAGASSGQTVFVHGAAGNVGGYAVQLARWRGLRVIASARAADSAAVRALADVVHAIGDIAAPISSGSFKTMGMVVAPCSIRSMAEIASGVTTTLLSRAADVVLKERRQLVLCRDTE